MKNKQRGYLNIPSGFFEFVFALAMLGLLALIGLAGYGVWWLLTHVSITP